MTFTAVLPILRRSTPDLLPPRHRPEHTVPTVSDVVVAGVSLTKLVEYCGIPALLTGDLPHPKPAQARAQGISNDVIVLVFQVTLRVDTDARKRAALTDCGFDRVAPRWQECQLIGRTPTAKSATIDLIPGETGPAPWPYPIVTLPSDIHQGDLLAVPFEGALALHGVRPCPQETLVPAEQVQELAVTR